MKKSGLSFIILNVFIAALIVVDAYGLQNQFNSQNLIGEWVAEWSYRVTVNGKVFLTIKSVEGAKVSGNLMIIGGRDWGGSFDNAILEGNILKIKTSSLDIELVFNDSTFFGFSLSGPYREQKSEIKNGTKIK